MPERSLIHRIARGLMGAMMGGFVGSWIFGWVLTQGFYAMVLPPVLLGLGGGIFGGAGLKPFAAVCAAAGLALGLFLEWKYFPFTADPSFAYFAAHLHQLRTLTWIMLLLGTIFSYKCALGPRSLGPKAESAEEKP